MVLGAREDTYVGWRAQTLVHAVELETGRAAAAQTKVTEDLVVDAGEDPPNLIVVGVCIATVIGAQECPLSGETNPGERLLSVDCGSVE